jgi:hypothetical protein
MSRTKAILITVLMLLVAAPASAALNPLVDLVSLESVMRWINAYRAKPEPAGVPAAVKALSRFGSFKDPEQSGVFVGFLAGVIATNPDKAEHLVNKMLPLPPGDQWVVVRAIAYSGHPDWRNMLRRFSEKLPARKVMIEKYLNGQLPRLYQYQQEPPVSNWDTLKSKVTGKELPKAHVLEPSPELLDTYWGYYFATGHARPIGRIIEMLPWSLEVDSVEKLTLGSMAKYTLASNASRDPELMVALREAHERAPKGTGKVLAQVIDAAETVETAKLRKACLPAQRLMVGPDRSGRTRGRLHRGRGHRTSLSRTALCDYGRRLIGGAQRLGEAAIAQVSRGLRKSLKEHKAVHRRQAARAAPILRDTFQPAKGRLKRLRMRAD